MFSKRNLIITGVVLTVGVAGSALALTGTTSKPKALITTSDAAAVSVTPVGDSTVADVQPDTDTSNTSASPSTTATPAAGLAAQTTDTTTDPPVVMVTGTDKCNAYTQINSSTMDTATYLITNFSDGTHTVAPAGSLVSVNSYPAQCPGNVIPQ